MQRGWQRNEKACSGRRECGARGRMERGDSVEFSIREHVEAVALLNRLLSRSRNRVLRPRETRGNADRSFPCVVADVAPPRWKIFVRNNPREIAEEERNERRETTSATRLNDTQRLNRRDIRAAEIPAVTSCRYHLWSRTRK